jgi:hypothetical protein
MSTAAASLYEQDFYRWLVENANLVRERRFAELDIENIAEELEALGRSEKRALLKRLAGLLMHLLKWQFQPAKRTNSWKYTIEEQRREVLDLLADSPSLRYLLQQKFTNAYASAILKAAKEMRLEKTFFPATCPFSLEQALDENFWPDAA